MKSGLAAIQELSRGSATPLDWLRLYSREELSVVVGNFFDEPFFAIEQEIRQRGLAIREHIDLVDLRPNFHADQSDENVEGHVKLRSMKLVKS